MRSLRASGGHVAAVIANAGVVNHGTVRTADPDAFARTVDVNLTGVYRTIAAALPYLVTSNGYALVIGSVGGYLIGRACAAHRGSVLGNLPGRPQPSQKMFESLLLHEISNLQIEKPVYVEGESKKIGQLQVPEALIARMRAAR